MHLRVTQFILALSCLSGLALAIGANNTIGIGLSLTLSGPPTARLYYGNATRNGLLLWWDSVRTTGVLIGGQRYYFNPPTILDDAGNATQVVQNYKTLLNDSSIDYFLGPVNTDFSNLIKPLTESAQRILIGTSAGGASFHQNASWTFSAVTSSKNFIYGAESEFRIKGAKTIGTIYENTAFSTESCTGWEAELAEQNIKLTTANMVPQSLSGVTAESVAALKAAWQIVAEVDPDVVFLCAYYGSQNASLKILKEINYFPRMLLTLPYISTQWTGYDVDLQSYLTGLSTFEASASWPTTGKNFGNPQMFDEKFFAKYRTHADSFSAMGANAALILQLALQKAGTTDNTVVRNSILNLNEETFMGRIQFGVDHGNQMPPTITQVRNGVPVVVSPPYAAQAEFVYPAPTWDEREYQDSFPAASEVALLVLASLAVASALFFVLYVLVMRNNSVIRASSPTFLLAQLLGIILLYISIYFSLWNRVSTANCHLQVWFLGLGFTLTFGALVVKTGRVWRLYSNKSVEVVRISDSQLAVALLGLVLISSICLVLLSSIGAPESTMIIVDEFRGSLNYYVCQPQNPVAWNTVIGILLGWNGLLVVVGLYLAFRVRRIPFTVYDESKVIAFSIYNVAFFTVLLVILELTKAAERDGLFLIRSIGILFCGSMTIGSMYWHKIRLIASGFEALSRKGSKGSIGTSKSAGKSGSLHSSGHHLQHVSTSQDLSVDWKSKFEKANEKLESAESKVDKLRKQRDEWKHKYELLANEGAQEKGETEESSSSSKDVSESNDNSASSSSPGAPATKSDE